jgi:hypothetical protein
LRGSTRRVTQGEAIVKLERYNQVAFALLATAAFIGGVAITAIAVWPHRGADAGPGVVLDAGTRDEPPPPQHLVFCTPIVDVAGMHEYVAVGAVVASDASLDPVLQMNRARYDKIGFNGCDLRGYGGAARIFNVVVRDRATNEQRLLLQRPGLIVGVEVPTADCARGEGPAPCGAMLWQIRAADTNGDGTLNDLDALVAYVSDLDAAALVAVTPVDATVVAAQWSAASASWYFQVRRDANADGRYSDEDGVELLETATASPAMARPLIDQQILASLRAVLE